MTVCAPVSLHSIHALHRTHCVYSTISYYWTTTIIRFFTMRYCSILRKNLITFDDFDFYYSFHVEIRLVRCMRRKSMHVVEEVYSELSSTDKWQGSNACQIIQTRENHILHHLNLMSLMSELMLKTCFFILFSIHLVNAIHLRTTFSHFLCLLNQSPHRMYHLFDTNILKRMCFFTNEDQDGQPLIETL